MIPETKAPLSLKRTLYFDILELVDLLSVPVLLFVVSQVTLNNHTIGGVTIRQETTSEIKGRKISTSIKSASDFRMETNSACPPRGLHIPNHPEVHESYINPVLLQFPLGSTRFDLYLKQQLSPRLT